MPASVAIADASSADVGHTITLAHGCEILLACLMAARGSSFIFSKILLDTMGPFNVLAVRFLCAFVLLAVIFLRSLRAASRRVWLAGFIVGCAYFMVMALEMIALTLADTGSVALVEHTAIVMVPFAMAILARRAPSIVWIASGIVATIGVGLLTATGGHLSVGLLIALGGAVAYTMTIIATDRLTPCAQEGLAIGVIQLGVLGVLALAASAFTEEFTLPRGVVQWEMMVMLVLVCTIFGFTLQPVAQAHLSAEQTGLLAAVNPAVASVLGAVVLAESFSWVSGVGVVFILAGITIPYLAKK
ncbi:Predicted permease%2C DMT superfamily [Chlamydia trachomatis]|nr:Predicted permease%2C DMT superfamily [Chlamydia trachomatis]